MKSKKYDEVEEKIFSGDEEITKKPLCNLINLNALRNVILIPPEILEIPDLSWEEKVLLSLIDQYQYDYSEFPSYEWLAENLEVSVNRVQKYIIKLKKMKILVKAKFSRGDKK